MGKLTPKQFKQQTKSMALELSSAVTSGLIDASSIAEEEFDNNFRAQGFYGESFKPWAENSEFTKKKKGHGKILHETGKLRKSRKKIFGNVYGNKMVSIIYSAFGKNGVNYASLMQEGFTTSTKKNTWVKGANVPARPFAKRSSRLDGRIVSALYNKIGKAFKTNYTIGR
jgi:phage gpG-like protein